MPISDFVKGQSGSHSETEGEVQNLWNPAHTSPTWYLEHLCACVFTSMHTPVVHNSALQSKFGLFFSKKKKKNSFLLGLQMLHWFPNLWPLLCHPLISFISHIGNPKGWICGSMIIIHKWILQGCWIQDQLKSIVFLRVCVCVCVCVC